MIFTWYIQECHMLSPLESNGKLTHTKGDVVEAELHTADGAQDPVSTQGSDDGYHSESVSSGRQKSAATVDTVKVPLC